MNENISCKRLGNLNGHTGGNYAGQVFDVEGIAPTIRTPTGGGLEPMIIEEGSQYEITEPISTNGTGIVGCLRATYYKNGERNIIKNLECKGGYEGVIEPISCAVRGRYTGENGETEQHLELGDSDVANCLTSVAKDSMVLEAEQEYVGVKQATKSGVIACEIGGGGRSQLSRKQASQREGSGQWADQSDPYG